MLRGGFQGVGHCSVAYWESFKAPRVRHALILGLGLLILANTRPFEGLVVSIPVAVILLTWLRHNRKHSREIILVRIIAPLTMLLVIAAGATGFYNLSVTGSPFRLPYLVHKETYMIAPLFIFQSKAIPKTYNHEVIRSFHTGWELSPYERQQSISGLLSATGDKLASLWGFYIGGVLTIPIIATLPLLLRSKRMRLPWVCCGMLIVALLTVNWVLPHYAAPVTGLLLLLVVQALRYLYQWDWREKPVGRQIVCAIPCALLASNLAFAALKVAYSVEDWSENRAQILSELNRRSGEHLVLVSYGENRPSYLRDHAE
jgi:hypothetical protein